MNVILLVIMIVIFPVINWSFDKISSRLEKENPSVFAEYGDAKNLKFAWQFIFMGLYKSENITDELKKYIRDTNIISLITIGLFILIILFI